MHAEATRTKVTRTECTRTDVKPQWGYPHLC
jgi:hypothetical protein